ncbi:unnamed protein product, partial [Medioppia subpectinata]
VDTYLGIPYAEPPVGDLRFRRPVPAKKWTKPLIGITFTNNVSEDCLYLNVFSPNLKNRGPELRPVLVVFHGGAFILDSSSSVFYNPYVLSTRGDVIIVSLNYRLGAVAMLYSGTDEAPGNQLFWDSTLALLWVQQNIAQFGGDPNRVTILGVSAGSAIVSGLILSPMGRHLFQNAVMMSGSIVMNGAVAPPEQSMPFWLKLSQQMGCATGSDATFTPVIMDCMRKVPIDRLTALPFGPLIPSHNKIDFAPLFVVDGLFFPKTPHKMLESGEFKKELNLMIGTAQDEGSMLLFMFVDPITYSMIAPKSFTFKEAYH